jgi:Capsule polysaccharide biosynthesis protein
MHFLFTTIQSFESDFYGTVGAELESRGHKASHLTVSRRSTWRLKARALDARCVPDLVAALPHEIDVSAEVARIEERYELPSIRDVYRTDPPAERGEESWCIRRTVDHFRAVERLFDELRPDVLVPEVGNELVRTVAHHVALARGVPTFFLFYTIFPDPLRLYVDTMKAPIVSPEDVRPLGEAERAEVEAFIRDFNSRRLPIRHHRAVAPTRERLRSALVYFLARLGSDRDNEYLRPGRWALEHVLGWIRVTVTTALYRRPRESRPFVYFPLHVTEDYKIKRVIPHFSDQASIVEQVAGVLPPGYDLVVKEHPLSIGQNAIGLLRRVGRVANVRLVHPHMSSHELIERSVGVVVLSSTVGLEALLYGKPVLTIGGPFYAGYGLTLDVDQLALLREQVPALMTFSPDRDRIFSFLYAAMGACVPGRPVLVDRSAENAATLAASLEAAGIAMSEAGEHNQHIPGLHCPRTHPTDEYNLTA